MRVLKFIGKALLILAGLLILLYISFYFLASGNYQVAKPETATTSSLVLNFKSSK